MKWSFSILGTGLMLSQLSFGATIAVIDSGLDTKHQDLAGKIWVNPTDSANNGVDEDQNGMVDDINGWNFFRNNNQLIDYRFGWFVQEDIRRFMDIQNKYIQGTASQDEIAWAKEKQKSRWFILKLMTFGNYVHGTHVAGIVARDNSQAKVIGIKLIPTLFPLGSVKDQVIHALNEGQDPSIIAQIIVKAGLRLFAKSQSQMFVVLAEYVNGHQADVVNGSFGTAMTQAKLIATQLLKLALKGAEPSAALVDEYARYLMDRMVEENKAMLAAAPKTLFVFAAGNDGSNNDLNPVVPANVPGDNRISVAATVGNSSLASFSNYGARNVDIAAPGVNIDSAIPGGTKASLSGTSQAAPYVANVAGAVKDANPRLTPAEIKKILMETVDVKDFLVGKVASKGVVNKDRAVQAAKLSQQYSVADAIQQARTAVADQPVAAAFVGARDPLFVMPLPSLVR